MKLLTPIEDIAYVGPKTVNRLNKIGIKTLKDLLFYFPRKYEDYSKITPISKAIAGEYYCFQAKILTIKSYRSPKKKMYITEAIIEDASGAMPVTWFNQPYIARQLKKGFSVNFTGQTKIDRQSLTLINPDYEILTGQKQLSPKKRIHSQRIVPVYKETRQITSRYLRLLIFSNLEKLAPLPDALPKKIRKKHNLLSLTDALKQIHFPSSWYALSRAKKRLAFSELFLIRLFLEKTRLEREKQKHAYAIPFKEQLVKDFVQKLPFELTQDQRRAAWQIIKDLQNSYPMGRLLEGDVGSGKTIVAAIASLSAVYQGYQVTIMAPTEVLARQHFHQISHDFKKILVETALLTSSEALWVVKGKTEKISKKKLIEKISTGEIKLVIGTHALIQKNVRFKKLALVVIDEQHRFGVEQRSWLLNSKESRLDHKTAKTALALREKKLRSPHLLSMSATPIPRTLSLVFYGDLKISRLKTMPKGRKKIKTEIVLPAERKKVYHFIRQEISKGRQAFIICPLIEESEKLQTKSVEKEFKKLSQEIFPDLRLALLHGRLGSKEKKEIMDGFLSQKYDILVSTSVIEVGVDIPSATIMVIEGSERFGLAQLHQLRGRVGRSNLQSYCFLFTEQPTQSVLRRLRAIVASQDGFELAEKDLALRGPGDFIGRRQSGIPDLLMASLSNLDLINLAKKEVSALLKEDSALKNFPLLRKKITKIASKIHLE